MPRENDELLMLRFTGPSLKERSLPIYELGTALIAFQRIIHKTALFEDGRLEKGASLKQREREKAALQIVSHRKSSDAWGFAPYLTDPATGPILQGLVVAGLAAIAAYVFKKVIQRDDHPKNQILIVNIFPEIISIIARIGNIGGVDGIEISSSEITNQDPLLISSDTQEYVREIQHGTFPGNRCKVAGYVTRLYPKSFHLELEDSHRHYVRVNMSPELFERIRVLPTLNDREFIFEGIPYYKLGDIGAKFSEFQAEQVILS